MEGVVLRAEHLAGRVALPSHHDEIAFDLPDPAGDKNILHILSNDPIQPDWTVELTGIGIAG